MPVITGLDALEELKIPEADVDPEKAKQHLVEFIDWVESLLSYLAYEAVKPDGECSGVFEESLITHLEKALQDIKESGQFKNVKNHIFDATVSDIDAHGLYGEQLVWKLENINHLLQLTKSNPRDVKLWDRLSQSVISLLHSLIDASGYGTALSEAVEAVKNAIALFRKKDNPETGEQNRQDIGPGKGEFKFDSTEHTESRPDQAEPV